VTGTATSEYAGRRVLVAGLGLSGRAAARALLSRGAAVTVSDDRPSAGAQAVAEELSRAGATIRLGDDTLPAELDLVVTSPGWRPGHPLLIAAASAGIEVIGEPELAWRLRPDRAASWLGVTGTNGKTTTVGMLASILQAAGRHAIAAGNVGLPLTEAVLAQPAYDVIAVELSSFQLHWSNQLRCSAAAILNIAEDHLDWHGSMADYIEDKARIFRDGIAVFNRADPWSSRLAAGRPHRIGFGLDAPPGPGDVGLSEDHLVEADGTVLAAISDVRLPGPHNLSNALAAAALARTVDIPPQAVAAGLASYAVAHHRNQEVATGGGVSWVDDSKATNPHAASASLAAYSSVVWVAGGLLKGADVSDLVREHAGRLRAVVALGRDRDRIVQALARHAPDIPVAVVQATDTDGMDQAVMLAAGLARPGDTVLLAPAAASWDMFTDYAERGDRFAAAAKRVASGA
jgi:UDP-N-acetylmuramoylalanine--D-glutamate ligase